MERESKKRTNIINHILLVNNIRYLCEIHNENIRTIEKKFNITPGYTDRIYNDRTDPKIDFICYIANHFNVSIEDLLTKDLNRDINKFKEIISHLDMATKIKSIKWTPEENFDKYCTKENDNILKLDLKKLDINYSELSKALRDDYNIKPEVINMLNFKSDTYGLCYKPIGKKYYLNISNKKNNALGVSKIIMIFKATKYECYKYLCDVPNETIEIWSIERSSKSSIYCAKFLCSTYKNNNIEAIIKDLYKTISNSDDQELIKKMVERDLKNFSNTLLKF